MVWPAQLGPTRVEYVRALAPPAAEYSCAVASQFTFTFMRGESFASQAHSRAPCSNALPRETKLKLIYLIQRTRAIFTQYVRTRMCAMPSHGRGRTSCAFSHVDAYACAGPVPVPLVIRRALSASADEGFGVWSRDWEEMRQGDGTAN